MEPRWEWLIDALLADRRRWDRWLPDLNELLGRKLSDRSAGYGKGNAIVDRRGYGDLLEYLFPTVVVGRDAISWRSRL